jgi:hypothetical protein
MRPQTTDVELLGQGYLYGAVTGPGGGWLPDVHVTLTDRPGTVVATTGTDGAGSYHFSDVPEGWYTVSTTAGGTVASVVDIKPGSAIAADLEVTTL